VTKSKKYSESRWGDELTINGFGVVSFLKTIETYLGARDPLGMRQGRRWFKEWLVSWR
jgi:hypothetical protein